MRTKQQDTSMQNQQRLKQQTEQENYKAIIFRESSYYGDKGKIRRLYHNLFENDFSDDENSKEN